MGVGSNLIVRDGGVRGVVIRLGRGFNEVTVEGDAGDGGGRGARRARGAAGGGGGGGPDLPADDSRGPIGGAVRMNAGCYGRLCGRRLRLGARR